MPAWTRISQLVTVIGPALVRLGERDAVDAALHRTWSEGNGASRQRRIFRETRSALAVTRAATLRVDPGR